MKKTILLLVTIVGYSALYADHLPDPDTINVRPTPTPVFEAGPVEFNQPLLKLQIPRELDKVTHNNLQEIKNKVHMLVERFNSLSDADKKEIAEHVKDKIMDIKARIHTLSRPQKVALLNFIFHVKHAIKNKVHEALKLHKATLSPAEEHEIAQIVRTLAPIKMAFKKTIMQLKDAGITPSMQLNRPGITHRTSSMITGNYGHQDDETTPEMNLIHE